MVKVTLMYLKYGILFSLDIHYSYWVYFLYIFFQLFWPSSLLYIYGAPRLSDHAACRGLLRAHVFLAYDKPMDKPPITGAPPALPCSPSSARVCVFRLYRKREFGLDVLRFSPAKHQFS